MEFNKEHLVIIDTLTPTEAVAFIKFLKSEIIRHKEDIERANQLIEEVERIFL